ncbi:MAG: hydroxyacid dehydrogenase [Planctomycetes bacterium]|nr:hydroxyacid dehydrogenase [Planctomycetota bacterium]
MARAVINTAAYLTADARRFLQENDCQVVDLTLEGLPESEFGARVRGVQAVIAGGEWWTERIFATTQTLEIVARTGAGVDRVDLAAAARHGVWVTNTPGATNQAVADFTLGLILCLLRDIPTVAQDLKAGRWNQFRGRELGSLTLGVVGTGQIGREVIKRSAAFGASILAHDIRVDQEFGQAYNVQWVSLDELMARSDIVTLHVPLGEQTRGIIDGRRLGLMKKTSYLVNTSRSAVVDKQALIQALEARILAGAAIDVHDPAPCPPDDPLVRLDNVLATPWTAYKTDEAIARMCSMAVEDVVAVLSGRPPRFPVNQPLPRPR